MRGWRQACVPSIQLEDDFVKYPEQAGCTDLSTNALAKSTALNGLLVFHVSRSKNEALFPGALCL